MAQAKRPIPEGYHSITPQLTLNNAAEAIEWYKRALGAEELSRSVGPDGKVMHAELKFGDSRVMMNDAMGMKCAKDLGGSPVGLWLYVENSDAVFERAVKAGATVQVPLGDQFWGDRGGAVADPEGYTWWIASRKEDLTHAEIEKRAMEYFKQMAQQPQG